MYVVVGSILRGVICFMWMLVLCFCCSSLGFGIVYYELSYGKIVFVCLLINGCRFCVELFLVLLFIVLLFEYDRVVKYFEFYCCFLWLWDVDGDS